MTTLKKFGTLAVAALAVAGVCLGTVEQASARDGRNAALFGGLAAGALLGGAFAGQSRGYDDYPAYPPAPAYRPAYGGYSAYGDYDAYEAPVVVRQCYRERRAVYDDWGDLAGYRRVKVCD